MTEAKKKPPLALVALAPLAGIYSLLMPYLYWRCALWLWGPGEGANASTCGACFAQLVAVIVYVTWRSDQ